MNYNEAMEFLNRRVKRKFARNTYLELNESGRIDVILHQTAIVSIYPDNSFELNTDGWFTWTTKNRINRIIGRSFVFSSKGDWFVSQPVKRRPIAFFNGMRLNIEGLCTNYWSR